MLGLLTYLYIHIHIHIQWYITYIHTTVHIIILKFQTFWFVFANRCSSVHYAKGDEKGSIEAPFLSLSRIRLPLRLLPGHFTQ